MAHPHVPVGEKQLIGLLLLLCGAVMSVGLVTSAWVHAKPSAEPIVLAHLSEAHIVEIRDANGKGLWSGEFRSRTDPLGNVEKDAALVDAAGHQVIGEVELEFPAKGRTDRRPELEVDVIGFPPNQRFTVVIDNHPVGVFATDDRGSADLEIQEGERLGP